MNNKFSEQDYNPDLYARLGLTSSASDDEIKKSYRRLAQKNHPDKFPGDKDKEARFVAVNRSYQVLSDPTARKLYDSALPRRSNNARPNYSNAQQKPDNAEQDPFRSTQSNTETDSTLKRKFHTDRYIHKPSHTDFEHPDFYKHYNYTQEEVDRYKESCARFGDGTPARQDLSTAFNFHAKDNIRHNAALAFSQKPDALAPPQKKLP